MRGPRPIDLTGQVFGRWTVLSLAEDKEHKNRLKRGSKGAVWLCRCECGTERTVISYNLRRGNSQSCGCWSADSGRAGYRVPL